MQSGKRDKANSFHNFANVSKKNNRVLEIFIEFGYILTKPDVN